MEPLNIQRLQSHPPLRPGQPTRPAPATSFAAQLNSALAPAPLKVSKHATARLSERNIVITDAEWARVTDKVNEAKAKGIRDSLVLMDQAALIVSAKNSTVITAMDRTEAKDQLFTNIDGTIILS
ncbi:TIGR02530 family flagellar biosynthesis protein [Sporosarcina koreensis]|uniref:TIGR02530 family flagellar biosynthesis protein n=1 Tax=Sporosarcina koreensis TaxID=334735 RepID=UPI00058DDB50|nr:TIGR02530 family flagellar biosynthesis protein [Sporosarcina koreensis]